MTGTNIVFKYFSEAFTLWSKDCKVCCSCDERWHCVRSARNTHRAALLT